MRYTREKEKTKVFVDFVIDQEIYIYFDGRIGLTRLVIGALVCIDDISSFVDTDEPPINYINLILGSATFRDKKNKYLINTGNQMFVIFSSLNKISFLRSILFVS